MSGLPAWSCCVWSCASRKTACRRAPIIWNCWWTTATSGCVSAPLQGLRIFPAQRGVGGFLLAQLIDWAQRKYADYAVTPITLHAAEVADGEARQIRERLLKRAGFHQSYNDEGRTQGKAQANRVGDLVASWNVERVQRLHVGELLQQLREQETQNRQQLAQITTLQARLEQYQRNDLGHRFAIGCLIVFSIFQALMLLWVVLR